MRAWPPWLSRLSVSVLSSVAANCSIAPLLVAGAVGELGQRPRGGRRLELRGTGARALMPGGSCDQLVVAGQRADLDDRLAAAAFVALGLQRAGVLERGDRAVLGERARVPAGQLAGVQRDRSDLALADARLDAAADQAGSSE